MKNVSAALFGLFPAVMLWLLGAIDLFLPVYFCGGLAAIGLCLIVYHILHRWHHPGIIAFLTLGTPLMFYVFTAVSHPVFLPLVYGVAFLVGLAGIFGGLVSGNWSWSGVGINIAFLCTVFILIIGLGSLVDIVYIEAGLLAAGGFGITRLCEIDFISWVVRAPRWIHKGMEKIWD